MSLYVPCYRPYTTNTTQTSIPPVGFEPMIPVSERPKTHGLDRAATGVGIFEPAIPANKWQQTHGLDRAATGIGSLDDYMNFIPVGQVQADKCPL